MGCNLPIDLSVNDSNNRYDGNFLVEVPGIGVCGSVKLSGGSGGGDDGENLPTHDTKWRCYSRTI